MLFTKHTCANKHEIKTGSNQRRKKQCTLCGP